VAKPIGYQGNGPIKEGHGARVIKFLKTRQGQPTIVHMADGSKIIVYDFA